MLEVWLAVCLRGSQWPSSSVLCVSAIWQNGSGSISEKPFFSFSDHVTIKLVVRFHDIFIASVDFSFYDCAAVALLWKSAP